MNPWRTADAVVSLVDGRGVDEEAPFEGDVAIAPAVRTVEGALQPLEDIDAEPTEAGFDVRRTRLLELRVRDDVGGWDW